MGIGEETAPVHAGEVLAGKYRVERVIGVGGMGIVVAATHLQLDQRVALKFLLPSAMKSAEVTARFAREARAAAKILSEHVARVIDVGTLESGSPFMVMEFLEGADLSTVLERRGRLPVEEVVGHVLQACEALAEAHAAGIIHRDLKPANLFLADRPGRAPIVKVLDFGISKTLAATPSEGAELTKTAALIGSPLYMSPEQLMSSKSVDARSDIWSLGVILYELSAGEPPFVAETMPQIVTKILGAPAPAIGHGVPASLEAVVRRCLSKEPAQRYANVAELAAALAPLAEPRAAEVSVDRISRVLGGMPGAPRVSRPEIVARPIAETAAWGATHAAPPPPRRSRVGLVVVVGALVVAALGAGVYAVAGGRGRGPDAASGSELPAVATAPIATPPTPEPMVLSLPAAPPLEQAASASAVIPPPSSKPSPPATPRVPSPPVTAKAPPSAAVPPVPPPPPTPTIPVPPPPPKNTLHPGNLE